MDRGDHASSDNLSPTGGPIVAAADEPPPASAHILDRPEAGGRAIRGAAVRTGGYAITSLLALASVPLLVRHLGIEEFGRYATVLSLVALVGGLTEAGLGPIGVREYTLLEPPARTRFMRHLLGLRLTLTAAGVLIATLFATGTGYGGELVLGTTLAGVALLLTAAQFTLAVPLQAELHLGRLVAAETSAQLLLVALVVTLVLTGAGLVEFLAAPILSGAALLATTVVLVRGKAPFRPAFGREWVAVLRDTLPVGLTTAVHTLYLRSTILIMSVIAVPLQTGYFATAYRLTEALTVIPVVLVGTTFPLVARAAHTDVDRLEYVTRRVLEAGLIAGTWMAATTAIGASFLIDLLAGDQGQPAVPVLRMQAVVLFLVFLSASFGNILLARRRHRALLQSSGIAFVVTVALGLALIPPLGAVGGAIAVVSGESVLVLAVALAVHREKLPLSQSLAILPHVALAGLAAAGVALAAPVSSVVAAAIFTVVYAVVLVWAGVIPPEIRSALARRPTRVGS